MIDMGRLASEARRPPMMKQQPRFEARWFYNLSLERLVPDDHLLRLIANAVDFAFIRPLCRPFYSHTGRPSVDPVVLFKMLLIGYLYGITSERRLARELSLNLAYRWFLGYDFDQPTPDHSVLSKARARFGPEVFESFFHRSIVLCREAGLLEEGPVYVDSTLIQASASADLMVPREDRAQPPLSIEEYVRRLYTENDPGSEDEEPPPPSDTGPSVRGRKRGEKVLPQPNRVLESKTDPEATLVNRPDFGRHLAYKAHVAVAGKRGQVITAAVATTGIEADEHLLAEVLWQHRRLSGLKLGDVVADAKYGTSFNFLYLGRLGLRAFIPLTRFGVMRKDIWGREHFRWLPEEDVYLCPAGEKLRRHAQVRGTQRVQYRAPRGSCAACRFRDLCAPSGGERTIHRSWGQEHVERTEALLAGPLGKQRLVQRKVYAEGAFGLAKELHGLRRTRFRGRRRVQIQLWLTAAAMNIKRAARQIASKGRPVAPALLAVVLTSLLRWLDSAAFQRPLNA
ncbi:MAG: IS1182 family transposase [Dehalococcoidia bacterium]|jgi:transposase|nr:IS1182 family transposase [Dehalococcoidia bacterium]